MLAALFLQLVLQVARAAAAGPLSVTSFCRTPERNERVGGVPGSLHLRCLAIDLVGDWADLQRMVRIWRAIGLDAVEYPDDGHIHLELDGPALR